MPLHIVQAETYLLSWMRYIDPVRAARVDDPAHYRWTSYRANALGQAETLLTPHPLYLGLGATETEQGRNRVSRTALLLLDAVGMYANNRVGK